MVVVVVLSTFYSDADPSRIQIRRTACNSARFNPSILSVRSIAEIFYDKAVNTIGVSLLATTTDRFHSFSYTYFAQSAPAGQC